MYQYPVKGLKKIQEKSLESSLIGIVKGLFVTLISGTDLFTSSDAVSTESQKVLFTLSFVLSGVAGFVTYQAAKHQVEALDIKRGQLCGNVFQF